MISETCQAPQFGDAAGANVIAFSRRDQAMPVINADDRPATSAPISGMAWAFLLVASTAAHTGIVAAFFMPPRPLPNAGIPAITVEIVLGDNAAAGLASSQGQEGATEVKAADAKPAEATALVPEMVRPATAVEAMVVARTPDSSPAQAQLEDVRRELDEIPPDQIASVSKPTRPRAQAPSSADGGISRGGSAADPNYRGRVAAHLARHKRFPSDARRRGTHGSVGIDFSIDGRGRVTAVRIARGSGHVSLDRAAEAMVWRASPFPAPPGGRPQRFSVPVSYSIR